MKKILGYVVIQIMIDCPEDENMSDLDVLDTVGSNCDYSVSYDDEETKTKIVHTEVVGCLDYNPL